jgi:flagellar P-ring protein precursor FlgI
VVGLDGTGDQTSQTPFTLQSIKNMLARYGVTIPPGTNPQLKNVAAVTVTADLPPFAKPGQASTSPWPRSAMPARCAVGS